MFDLGKLGRGWLVAGALALSVCVSACGSSSGNNAGAGGSTGSGGAAAAGGATGSGGATGTGGMTTVTDGGMDVPVNDSGMDTGTDTNPTTGDLPTHLMLINGANSTFNGQTTTSVGVPVTTPAPTMSLASCQI